MLYELPKLLHFWPSAVDAKFSSDGTKLAVAAEREALVYELPTMRQIGPLRHDRPVAGVYFTRQGERLATVAREENEPVVCRIWETRFGKAVTESREFEDDGFWMWETPSITFT